MNESNQIIKAIIDQGMLPLYFNADATVSVEILQALYQGGVRVLEYTNRGAEAKENFKQMLKVRDTTMPGLLLGIGTIKNLSSAKEFLEIGADFLISPGMVPEVAEYAVKHGIFYAPGCTTTTEIIAAENAGLKFIKLFPGNMLGPEFMSSIKDIFPDLYFMPTGGVDTTEDNIAAWFKSGVCAVGMGSKLISKKLMQDRDYDTIERDTMKVLDLIKSIKN